MPDIALQFANVTFGFGSGSPLFDNFSCDISNDLPGGKIVALMGSSGVGKSTFCELIVGVRRPQKGTVVFTPAAANVAVIPQKGIIFDELSVEDNIACLKYSRSLGSTFRSDRVRDAAATLGLLQVLENRTPANALSGGEAQRVMLARIQTVACNLLILDEPCSFLDNRIKDSFLAALRATVDEHRLLALFVTHVWAEARLVADEIVFFDRQRGRPATVHRRSIADAESRPPTIDAMFAIHWPHCSIRKISDLPAAFLSSQTIPANAAFMGTFPRASALYPRDHDRTRCANRAEESSADGAGLAGTTDEITTRDGERLVFYDAAEMLVESMAPTL